MQSYSILIANQRIDELIAEAARHRRYARPTPSLRSRLASVTGSFRLAPALNGLAASAVPLPR